jgi:hypothetical protein
VLPPLRAVLKNDLVFMGQFPSIRPGFCNCCHLEISSIVFTSLHDIVTVLVANKGNDIVNHFGLTG